MQVKIASSYDCSDYLEYENKLNKILKQTEKEGIIEKISYVEARGTVYAMIQYRPFHKKSEKEIQN